MKIDCAQICSLSCCPHIAALDLVCVIFFAATSEDYKLMEKLNLVTADKFKELTQRAVDIQDSMGELQVSSSLARILAGTSATFCL